MMDWDDLRYFLAVARAKGLTGAAKRLRASPSTISRRVAGLEESIGAKLFVRHQTGYILTDEGSALLHRAEHVEASVDALKTEASERGSAVRGAVRLATAENLATHIIIPALPGFTAAHPGIVLEIATGIGSIGLSRREADLALRLVRPAQENLIVRKVGVQAYALYATSACLEATRRSRATGGERFSTYRFILWDEMLGHLPMARWLAGANEGRQPALVTTSLQAQLAGAQAGLGFAVLPCFMGDMARDLVRVLEPDEVIVQDIWLVLHPDLAGSARVRCVADFVVETIEAARTVLAGTDEGPCRR